VVASATRSKGMRTNASAIDIKNPTATTPGTYQPKARAMLCCQGILVKRKTAQRAKQLEV
jgi:hypothetical protein